MRFLFACLVVVVLYSLVEVVFFNRLFWGRLCFLVFSLGGLFFIISLEENIGVEFVHIFGHGVGRQGRADEMLHLGQARVISVGGAGGRIDKAPYAAVSGRQRPR